MLRAKRIYREQPASSASPQIVKSAGLASPHSRAVHSACGGSGTGVPRESWPRSKITTTMMAMINGMIK